MAYLQLLKLPVLFYLFCKVCRENLIFNGHLCLVGCCGGWVDVVWDFVIMINPDGEMPIEQGKRIRFINKYILI